MNKYNYYVAGLEWSLFVVVVEAAQRLVVEHAVVSAVVDPKHGGNHRVIRLYIEWLPEGGGSAPIELSGSVGVGRKSGPYNI